MRSKNRRTRCFCKQYSKFISSNLIRSVHEKSIQERRKFASSRSLTRDFSLINSRLDQFETYRLREPDTSPIRIEEKLDSSFEFTPRPRCRMSKPVVLFCCGMKTTRSVVTSRRLMTPDYAAIFVHQDARAAARNCVLPIRESHSHR